MQGVPSNFTAYLLHGRRSTNCLLVMRKHKERGKRGRCETGNFQLSIMVAVTVEVDHSGPVRGVVRTRRLSSKNAPRERRSSSSTRGRRDSNSSPGSSSPRREGAQSPKDASSRASLHSPRSEHGQQLAKMLNDKNKLIEHFQKTHTFTEPLDFNREKTTRRNSTAENSPVLPKQSRRTIHLKAETRLQKNISLLKKHVKRVGKAAILLEMMKPSMITHKKAVKPQNYDACKQILGKSQFLRTRKDCEALLMLVKNVKFFQELSEDAQLELCKVMNHVDVAWARQTIMQQGDAGSTFFVIIVGSFYVQIQVAESKNLKTVAHLHPGDSFGEAALISNQPRNATIVSAEPSELLKIEKADYERVIKKLHVDALMKKVSFIRSVPAFQTFSEEVTQDLASRVFFQKVPIHTNVWKQGDAVDQMKYLLIVKHGEVHVMKNFKVKKKRKGAGNHVDPAATPVRNARRGNIGAIHQGTSEKKIAMLKKGSRTRGSQRDFDFVEKRADLCTLGPTSAFLERSMFENSAVTSEEDLEEKIMHEKSETRGSTLVTGCCCEIGWLSKHIFNQLTRHGTTLVNYDKDNIEREATPPEQSRKSMMSNLSEWMLEYPTEKELRSLFIEDKLWKEFKENVVLQAKSESQTKRAHVLRKIEGEDSIIEKIREAKYGSHPLHSDLKLPFRKPVDLLPMSIDTDLRAPEFGLAPTDFLYNHVDRHLIPTTMVRKVDPDKAGTFGYVSPVNSPRKDDGSKVHTPRPPEKARSESTSKKPSRKSGARVVKLRSSLNATA